MITLKQRTQQALEAGFTNAQLAAAAGVSSGAVSQWLTTTKTLKAESVIGLVKLTGWRHEWWAQGRGSREAGGGSMSEPEDGRYTSETITHKVAISIDASHPEGSLLLRLLSAAKGSGITVEVKKWKEPEQVAQTDTARERRVGRTGAVVVPSRSNKRGAA